MKNFTITWYTCLLVFGAMLFGGCTKDTEGRPAVASGNAASATMGVRNYIATKLVATTKAFPGGTLIGLNYISQAGDTLTLGIDSAANTGWKYTYEMQGLENDRSYSMTYSKHDGTHYLPDDSNKGELTITLHDKKARTIKGIFSGNLTSFDFNNDQISLTAGKFEAKY